MITRKQYDAFLAYPATQWTLFAVGVILIILSPVAGVIPGPGGVIVFGIGLGLVLKTSMWAKRRYVHFKRWQPGVARWTDWGLRRRSARRREELRKQRREIDQPAEGTSD